MKLSVVTIVFQVILLILFAWLVKYDPDEAGPEKNTTLFVTSSLHIDKPPVNQVTKLYSSKCTSKLFFDKFQVVQLYLRFSYVDKNTTIRSAV